jgi:Leucine-rich repeat (LRR) protein
MSACDGDAVELTERLLLYATGQFDPSLIHTAMLPMLNIAFISPSAFARCGEYLTSLDLSRNNLSSVGGLEHLKALKLLNLSYNRVTHVGDLSKYSPMLEVLHLEGNHIADLESLNCFDAAIMPKLRALHLQQRDGSDANPVCSNREAYVAFAGSHFQHVRCIDGHYFDRMERQPRYVDGGGDTEVELPQSQPWIGEQYFGNALLEAPKIGVIPEKAFVSQVSECKRVLKEHIR